MSTKSKLKMSPEFVRELHLAEERFLEVLVSAFDIHRRSEPKAGFELHVSFDERTPAIWDRRGIQHLREEVLREEKRIEHQKQLDAFLYRGGAGLPSREVYSVLDEGFAFRYVSGGTLPIVSFSEDPPGKEYYCLTYREIEPIGWNLINGGSDNRDEMMDPEQTIKRELHEELIVVDLDPPCRYEFRFENGNARDLPAHAVARSLLDLLLPQRCLKDHKVEGLPVQWIHGPDSVRIRMGNNAPVPRSGFFLNINGLDFGIELDKIARITLPKSAVMFFGETDRGHLLNCPVGLFDVKRFSPDREPEELQREAFRPDLFFFNGKLHRYGEIDGVLAVPFIEQLRGHLDDKALAKFEACLGDEARYALCPVTARIILRHRRREAEQESKPDDAKPDGGGEGLLPDDMNWATQAELCRAVGDVLCECASSADGDKPGGDGAPHKSTLSRAIGKGHILTNNKPARANRVNINSFLAWIAKQRSLDNREVRQIENAIIGEIRKRER